MDKEKTCNNLPPKIKKFLFIEDGSVDTDDLGKRLASVVSQQKEKRGEEDIQQCSINVF